MEDFEEILIDMIDEEEEEEIDAEDEVKLAEIYRLATRLIKLLDELKSYELKEAASLMLIKEIVGDDKLLLGLASKMLQDITFGFENDESYVS
jgi:argonaute-like protein implicated in RNA metabolism and viral defense